MSDENYIPDSPEKIDYQSQLFANRLIKNYKQLKKQNRKNKISCFRIYDRDIPEVPLACDIYTFLPANITNKNEALEYWNEKNAAISRNDSSSDVFIAEEKNLTYLHLYLYERPYEKPESEENKWLDKMACSAAGVLQIPENHVLVKTRKRFDGDEKGRNSQYEKIESKRSVKGLVFEQGQIFNVNLTEYIDTGLFFDHRPLRKSVREISHKKRVLNLFCYTGSFSVYAAEGGASFVESVDTSNTYLDWAKKNFKLNSFDDEKRFIFTRQDVRDFLKDKKLSGKNTYDIIILDPPTFSNSKRNSETLDINRDWPDLVADCLSLLSPDGILFFSTNSRKLKFDEKLLPRNQNNMPACIFKDITPQTIPADYRNKKIHRCWKISFSEEGRLY